MINKTIETILNHRSIRQFTDKKLTDEQIHTIVLAAQQASTSSYVMAYTIIGITDSSIKAKLSAISRQSYVEDNGHLFVFCADLHRISQQAPEKDQLSMQESLESTEQFIVSTIDTALAAQNAAIAAESMGLGICYIGSLRNNIQAVNDILELPELVIPLFGMTIGYPDQQPEVKPRLPLDVIYHQNKYSYGEKEKELLIDFNEQVNDYYKNRNQNERVDTWSEQMIRKYETPIRMDVTQYVKEKRFNRR